MFLKKIKDLIVEIAAYGFGTDAVSYRLSRPEITLRDRIAVLILGLHTGQGINRSVLVAQNIIDDFSRTINIKEVLGDEPRTMPNHIRQLVFQAGDAVREMKGLAPEDQAYPTNADLTIAVDKFMTRFFNTTTQ
jgi:hypothetical protein